MKSLMLILVFGVLAMQGFGQEPTPADCQFSTIVLVDGQADEWPVKWLEDDEKKFFYNVCTDQSNIYVRMKVKEDMIKRKLGLFGLTLWMDPGGKKKKKLGLRFPTGTEGTEVMERYKITSSEDFKTMSSSQRAEFQKEMEHALIQNVELMELIGLTDEPLTSTRSGITNGIKVAIGQDAEGAYVYEAIVPFKSFRMSKSSLSSLGIGLETGHFTAPPAKAQKGGGSGTATAPGQSSNGSYGTRFSASNMAVGQGYQGNRGPMSIPVSFWMNIKLKK